MRKSYWIVVGPTEWIELAVFGINLIQVVGERIAARPHQSDKAM